MVGSSTSRGFWRAIRQPFARASVIWRRKRMRRLGASEKKGGASTASRRATDPRSEPPPTVARVHRWRSDARRCAVDQPVAARGVATPVSAGHTRESPHYPTAAEKTQTGPTHRAQEKDDGPPSRPPCPI